MSFSDTADVAHLAILSRLTHLDLGYAGGLVALAPRLPNLQSLALYVPKIRSLVSAPLPSAAEALRPPHYLPGACCCLASMRLHGV